MFDSMRLRFILVLFLALGFATRAGAAAQVRVIDPLTVVREMEDLQSAPEREVLRLVAPRNGCASAVVVVTGAAAAELVAQPGPLTGEGDARIPEDTVRIRYAVKGEAEKKVDLTGNKVQPPRTELDTNFPYFDILLEEPPAEADILPVWVTVDVPSDAEPGTYRGSLELAGEEVPVRLDVGEWVCPDPSEWVHHAQFDLHCDTLVEEYGVELWSAEHWELIGKCFDLMKQMGNKDLHLSLWMAWRLNQPGWSPLGDLYPQVRFRKGEDGLVPDMAVVNRYLELYAERVGEPHALVVCAFDPAVWDFGVRDARRHKWPCPSWRAVVVDEEGGRRLELLPLPGEPSGDELWTRMMDEIHRKVLDLAWDEEVIHIGLAHDGRPPQNTVDFFKSCAPYARWALWTHGRGDPAPEGRPYVLDNGLVAGHYTHAYALGLNHVNEKGVMGGWNMPYPIYTHPRKYIYQFSPLSQWRQFPDGCTSHPPGGFKRSGAGFDHVRFNAWGKGKHYGYAWSNFYRQGPRWIVAPGPDGPLGTARLEMLREGQQETEARIALEKAVSEGRLSADLEKRCSDLLVRRWQALRKEGKFNRSHAEQGQTETSRLWGVPGDWQDSALELFNLAGRVAAED